MDVIDKTLLSNPENKLKKEVEDETSNQSVSSDLERFLLTASTFTKEQLNEIKNTRKAINKLGTKLKFI